MPTPEHRLAELLGAAPPPSDGISADEVVRLAQRRRSTWLTAGAAAVVVLLVLAVTSLAQRHPWPRAAGRVSGGPTEPTPTGAVPPGRSAPPVASAGQAGQLPGRSTAVQPAPADGGPPTFPTVGISWTSAQRGWALAARSCGSPCRATGALMSTADGGRTWHDIPTPRLRSSALGMGVKLVDERRGYVWAGAQTWFTADAGAHWAGVSPARVVRLDVRGDQAYAVVASTPVRGSDCLTDFTDCQVGVVTGQVGSRSWASIPGASGGNSVSVALSTPGRGPLAAAFPPLTHAGCCATGGVVSASWDGGAHWTTDSPCYSRDLLVTAVATGDRVAAICEQAHHSYVVSSAGPGKPYVDPQPLPAQRASALPVTLATASGGRLLAATPSASGEGEVPVRVLSADTRGHGWREVLASRLAAMPDQETPVLDSSGGVVTWIPDGLHAWRSLDGGLTWTTLRLPP